MPIQCRFISIKRQSDVNQLPIQRQSVANSMPIRRQSSTDPTPIKCQSIPIWRQSDDNQALIQCQSSVFQSHQVPIHRQSRQSCANLMSILCQSENNPTIDMPICFQSCADLMSIQSRSRVNPSRSYNLRSTGSMLRGTFVLRRHIWLEWWGHLPLWWDCWRDYESLQRKLYQEEWEGQWLLCFQSNWFNGKEASKAGNYG